MIQESAANPQPKYPGLFHFEQVLYHFETPHSSPAIDCDRSNLIDQGVQKQVGSCHEGEVP